MRRSVPWILLTVATALFLVGLAAQALGIGRSSGNDTAPAAKVIFVVSGVLCGAALIVWPLSPTFIRMVVDAYRITYIGDPELPHWVRRIAPAATVLFGIFLVWLMFLYWRS